ncbi:hypothetical protein OJF2_34430 [Aquisphaera giovannonii]|uniref:Uncharacterized protein n=1 Tax=Aquisphaera giovannonii TaxID=406548 RepID=A0A5B9W2T5_9BACT|nr:hypothetical protein OJF2_34430 [Aquisphaera giovannonii]
MRRHRGGLAVGPTPNLTLQRTPHRRDASGIIKPHSAVRVR